MPFAQSMHATRMYYYRHTSVLTLYKKYISILHSFFIHCRPNAANAIDANRITPAHLIFYDTENHLLPIIMSHCNYSLEIGEGTRVDYDYVGMEKQIENRFIKGKPYIKYSVSLIIPN